MDWITKLVIKQLRSVADKIEAGNCNITNEQANDILEIIANELLSKEQACSYLNISRSKFDTYVREGKIPRGIKQRGFNALFWRKCDLIKVLKH